MESMLDYHGLLDVVEKGVAGQDKCGSVIGADEMEEVQGAHDGASVGSSGLANNVANLHKASKAYMMIPCARKSPELLRRDGSQHHTVSFADKGQAERSEAQVAPRARTELIRNKPGAVTVLQNTPHDE
jgi:hypothetical protein